MKKSKPKNIIAIQIVGEEETDANGDTIITVKVNSNKTNEPLYMRTVVDDILKQHLQNSQFKSWQLTMFRDLSGNIIDQLLFKIAKKEKPIWNVS